MKYTKFIPKSQSVLDDVDTHADEWLVYIDAVLKQETYEKECADRNSKIVAEDLYVRLAESDKETQSKDREWYC